jgi:hypothetical protein
MGKAKNGGTTKKPKTVTIATDKDTGTNGTSAPQQSVDAVGNGANGCDKGGSTGGMVTRSGGTVILPGLLNNGVQANVTSGKSLFP